ncbi:hypothetical protein BDZ89DRAFT_1068207 [Hymenopellis radicata]|nr:hypothetical protein BDZ89DRAFT_1068207 [Hymenopellis radicata]
MATVDAFAALLLPPPVKRVHCNDNEKKRAYGIPVRCTARCSVLQCLATNRLPKLLASGKSPPTHCSNESEGRVLRGGVHYLNFRENARVPRLRFRQHSLMSYTCFNLQEEDASRYLSSSGHAYLEQASKSS